MPWHAGVVRKNVQKWSLDLIEALPDVSRPASERRVVERSMLNVDGSGIPGVTGADPGYAGEHVIGGPCLHPGSQIVKPR